MINEHDRVVLTEDVPREGLKAGDVGTIVHIHAGGEAYEVEFICLDGQTVAVVTLKANRSLDQNRRNRSRAGARRQVIG